MERIGDQYACSQEWASLHGLGCLPIADTEASDTVCHLDDNKLSAALHLARLTLPDLMIHQPSLLCSDYLART